MGAATRTGTSVVASGREPTRLLTVSDVAECLRCSRQAVYRWVESGEIPHLKIGRLVRFLPDDVESFLSTCRRTQDRPRGSALQPGSSERPRSATIGTAAARSGAGLARSTTGAISFCRKGRVPFELRAQQGGR